MPQITSSARVRSDNAFLQAAQARSMFARTAPTARDRRVAAKTAANNSAPAPLQPEPPQEEPEPDPGGLEAAELEASDAAESDEEHVAEVIPLGVYDPHQEAQRWW